MGFHIYNHMCKILAHKRNKNTYPCMNFCFYQSRWSWRTGPCTCVSVFPQKDTLTYDTQTSQPILCSPRTTIAMFTQHQKSAYKALPPGALLMKHTDPNSRWPLTNPSDVFSSANLSAEPRELLARRPAETKEDEPLGGIYTKP